MPPRKGLRTNPRSYVAPGGRWPEGPFEADEGEKLPPELFLLQNISKALRGVVEDSERSLCRPPSGNLQEDRSQHPARQDLDRRSHPLPHKRTRPRRPVEQEALAFARSALSHLKATSDRQDGRTPGAGAPH